MKKLLGISLRLFASNNCARMLDSSIFPFAHGPYLLTWRLEWSEAGPYTKSPISFRSEWRQASGDPAKIYKVPTKSAQ